MGQPESLDGAQCSPYLTLSTTAFPGPSAAGTDPTWLPSTTTSKSLIEGSESQLHHQRGRHQGSGQVRVRDKDSSKDSQITAQSLIMQQGPTHSHTTIKDDTEQISRGCKCAQTPKTQNRQKAALRVNPTQVFYRTSRQSYKKVINRFIH